jgi:hypothetical protein
VNCALCADQVTNSPDYCPCLGRRMNEPPNTNMDNWRVFHPRLNRDDSEQ